MARLLKFDNFVDEKLDIRPVRKVELSEIKKRIKEDGIIPFSLVKRWVI